MKRVEIINTIGSKFLQSNIENDEFSYPKELKKLGKTINKNLIKSKNTTHEKLDIRFVKDNISILVETKNNFDQWKEEETYTQLQAYVNY